MKRVSPRCTQAAGAHGLVCEHWLDATLNKACQSTRMTAVQRIQSHYCNNDSVNVACKCCQDVGPLADKSALLDPSAEQSMQCNETFLSRALCRWIFAACALYCGRVWRRVRVHEHHERMPNSHALWDTPRPGLARGSLNESPTFYASVRAVLIHRLCTCCMNLSPFSRQPRPPLAATGRQRVYFMCLWSSLLEIV